jgi:hypothetical protein
VAIITHESTQMITNAAPAEKLPSQMRALWPEMSGWRELHDTLTPASRDGP